ncbi:MAG: hypothetical protein RL701_3816 [Pseudomonadota bacterium]|jgi:hypothetical protein
MKKSSRRRGNGRALDSRAPLLVVVLGLCLAAVAAIVIPKDVRSQEHNFAGSLQSNYTWVPTDPHARNISLDGMTTELSLKVAVDFTDNVSANVKLCYTCHGMELGMAFIDMRLLDELNIRVGRFNPGFGDFSLRHDPANHRTADKPLPYDMGRMLRMKEFNIGVLPSPYVDQGIELNGTHWFGDAVQLDYAFHAVGGLRAGQNDLDVDFISMRSVYYIDNNSEPSLGGRVALTLNLSDDVLFTAGGSGLWGHLDPKREHAYWVAGADVYLRIASFDLHAEYLIRRTEYSVGESPDTTFRYGPGKDGRYENFFLKDGFYVEGNMPLSRHFEVVARFDGLRRIGNVTLNSPLKSKNSSVLRYTLGIGIILEGSVRLKFSGEYYDFTDFDDDVAVNAGVAAAF